VSSPEEEQVAEAERPAAERSVEDAIELTPTLRRLWRQDDRSRPGPRPGLTLERILDAAALVVDADGLEGLSMSRLASELGFTTMSLYRYVDSKDELLSLLVDHATGEPPAIPDDVTGWRDRLAWWVEAQMGALRRRPWIVQLPITGPPMGPNTLAWVDQGLVALGPSGLSEREKVGVIGVLAGLVRHEALVRADIARALRASEEGGVPMNPALQGNRAFTDVLLRLVDPDRLPGLAASLQARAWDEDDDMEADFLFGLERILDGVEVLAARHAEDAGEAVDGRAGG
jgi:AcrR family transcriptional regulator